MKICWENQVWAFYLIPHSSHALQLLNLACFSFVKSKYRQAITDLVSINDSAPIKKLRFVQYYQEAREAGLRKTIYMLDGKQVVSIPGTPTKSYDPIKLDRRRQH